MKKRNGFLLGLLVVLLAMGLVLAGCGDGDSGDNSGGQNSGGNNQSGNIGLIAKWYPSQNDANSESYPYEASFEFKANGEFYYWGNGGLTYTATSNTISIMYMGSIAGSASYFISGTKLTLSNVIGGGDGIIEAGDYYKRITNIGGNNPGGGHTHLYGSWQSNATQHWKVCIVSGCTNPPSESERGNHSGNPCVTCGYSNIPQIKTPPKASYIYATGNVAWINLSWSFPESVENVIIEVWSPSSRSWKIDTTLPGSATVYDFRYKGGGVDYVVSGTNGPQGISAENFCVFLRIRGRNGTELGPRKAMMWDTLYSVCL